MRELRAIGAVYEEVRPPDLAFNGPDSDKPRRFRWRVRALVLCDTGYNSEICEELECISIEVVGGD